MHGLERNIQLKLDDWKINTRTFHEYDLCLSCGSNKLMIDVVIVGLGEAGKSCYRTLLEIKQFNVKNINTPITSIDVEKKVLYCNKISFKYDYLVICTGASPRQFVKENPHIKTTRDFKSIQQLADIAKVSNRIAVLGNGGVSLEVVNEFRNMEVIWIFKDDHIGKDFFDTETSKYFYPFVFKKTVPNKNDVWAYIETGESPDLSVSSSDLALGTQTMEKPLGPALGPIWKDSFRTFIKSHQEVEHFRDIKFEPETTISDILDAEDVALLYKRRLEALKKKPTLIKPVNSNTEWSINKILDFSVPPTKIKELMEMANNDLLSQGNPIDTNKYPLYIKLRNGHIYGVDYLICGLGVMPNTSFIKESDQIKLSKEGGILVDQTMKTSIDNIYAAGDVATIEPVAHNFIQKRLWSQARVMGITAAQSIIQKCLPDYIIPATTTSLIHFCMLPCLSSTMIGRYFSNFVHVTSFFGLRTVFIGRYNGQGLVHTTEYYSAGNGLVKYVKSEEKIRGAILVGETGIEVSFNCLFRIMLKIW